MKKKKKAVKTLCLVTWVKLLPTLLCELSYQWLFSISISFSLASLLWFVLTWIVLLVSPRVPAGSHSEVFHSAEPSAGQPLLPTATCKQLLQTGMDLQERMGKVALLQQFQSTLCCLPYEVFLGFVCRSNIIKNMIFLSILFIVSFPKCSWSPWKTQSREVLEEEMGWSREWKEEGTACSALPLSSMGVSGRSAPI